MHTEFSLLFKFLWMNNNHIVLNGAQKTRNANLRNLFSIPGHGIYIILYIIVVKLN